jgi:MOSC domain-containing protein YiiM
MELQLFSSKELLYWTQEVEWTPFQTHYFSENLVVQGIEPRSLDL